MRQLPIPKTEGVELLVGFLEWLEVSNADRLPQDGVLDDNVEAGLAEAQAMSTAHANLVRIELNAIALIVGDSAEGSLSTFHTTEGHEDFLKRLKEGAAREKQVLLAAAANGDRGWPPVRVVG